MSGLEDLLSQIPTSDIASKIGVDEAEVNKAVQLLVPVLVGGLHENAQDPEHASKIESAADSHAGLLDGGVNVDQVDQNEGQQAIARDLRRQRRRPGRQRAGRRWRRQQRSAQAAAADPGADRSGLYRKAARPEERTGQGRGGLRRRAQRRPGQHPRRNGRRQQVAGHCVGQRAGLQGGRHSRRIAGRQEVSQRRPTWAVFVTAGGAF